MSETCWAFSYSEPKRVMTLLPICRMHTKDALEFPLEDLSDRRQTWTAGGPPRTRKLRGARVVAPRHVEAKRDGDTQAALAALRRAKIMMEEREALGSPGGGGRCPLPVGSVTWPPLSER